MTKKLLAILFAAIFTLGLCGMTFGAAIPPPTAEAGVLIDLTGSSAQYTMMVGLGVGDLDLGFGFANTTVSFMPTIHKGLFFGGLLMKASLPTSSAHHMSLALPIGIYYDGPFGFVQIGYSYPIVNYLEPGLFVQFGLRVDVWELVTEQSP